MEKTIDPNFIPPADYLNLQLSEHFPYGYRLASVEPVAVDIGVQSDKTVIQICINGKVCDLTPLVELGNLIATQDNRYTDQPMFIVQQKMELPCAEDREGGFESTRYIWINRNEGYECDENESAYWETRWKNNRTINSDFERIKVGVIWQFVTACLTEQGCKDYLKIDGHNLKETRIQVGDGFRNYAAGSYRNNEFRMVRNILLDLAKLNETSK
jgi:hypothetical protein